jgi:hypothetical protein
LFQTYHNNPVAYYAKSYLNQVIPGKIFRLRLHQELKKVEKYDPSLIQSRLNYYNKLKNIFSLKGNPPTLKSQTIPKRQKVYYFDMYEFSRFFNPELFAYYAFGDVTHIPEHPAFVKSRPIAGSNSNSVMLKLEKMRHFNFIKDPVPFDQKKNMLIGMSFVDQPHRILFMEKHFNNPLCQLGQINKGTTHDQWYKPKISIRAHLNYKFILTLEGNDVATSLKWVMSSGSLAVMPLPTYETWYMEGTLIPDYHYIKIEKDYSDLNEKLNYFIENPDKARQITLNAHQYIEKFRNPELEKLLSLLVLKKYFVYTGQMEPDKYLEHLF